MKRQIKFRGKRVDTGEWIFGDLLTSNGTECEISDWNDVVYSRYDVDPDTVGQFTGLLDKSGKEIYKGDILSANGKIIGYVVDGVRGYCYDVVYTPPRRNEYSWSLYSVVTDDYPSGIEVIGSIYDSPELLKGGNT